MKRLLITGGCGFVGSNIALLFKEFNPTWEIIAFDNLRRRGSELNLIRLKEGGVNFVHGDIRNKEDFDALGKIDVMIEAAAEPSVLAGLDGATDYVINTNLIGTINSLNYAAKHRADIIFLSTSRIYPYELLDAAMYEESATRFEWKDTQAIAGISKKGVTTDFPLQGVRSLYGATKLASELLLQEYKDIFGLRTVINRCGVLTGPWQMGKVDQGVIVLWLAKHFWKGNLSYNGYGGEGKQVRDILHVKDLFMLLLWQINNIDKINGEIFNVGGGLESSVSLKELTNWSENLTGNRITIQSVNELRKADVRLYITDNSRVSAITGWKPQYEVGDLLEEIYKWIFDHQTTLKQILS